MKIIYFGNSVPLSKIPDKLIPRNLNIINAGRKREEYLLNIISQVKVVKRLYFISTAYGSTGGVFNTAVVEKGNRKYFFLGYYGKGIVRILTSYLYAFFWIVWNVKRGDTLITYNFSPIYAIPILLKKLFLNFRLIIEFEDFYNKDDKRSVFYGPFENLGIKIGDAFIASSTGMSDHIKDRNRKAKIIINSGYFENVKTGKTILSSIDRPINIIYSGTLDKERGIYNLITSFQKNKSAKFELVVSGSGPLENYVIETSAQDTRIHFVGLLNDGDYNLLLAKADVCINPQWSSISVNFPSKITMYLSYGKIVMSTKIDSLIRSPFNELLIFYDEDNSDAFWEKLFFIEENWFKLEAMKKDRIKILKQITEVQKKNLMKLICK